MKVWVTAKNHEWISEVTSLPLETVAQLYKEAREEKKILTLETEDYHD